MERLYVVIDLLANKRLEAALEKAKTMEFNNEKLITPDGLLTKKAIGWWLNFKCKLGKDLNSKVDSFMNSCQLPRLKEYDHNLLRVLQIVNEDGELTSHGRRYAITKMPLETQCEILGLTLCDKTLPKSDSKVEQDALNSFLQDGYQGVVGEESESAPFEGILWAISVALLLKLQKVNPAFECKEPEKMSPRYFFNEYSARNKLHRQRFLIQEPNALDAIDSISEYTTAVHEANLSSIEGSFRFFGGSFFSKRNPNLKIQFLLDFFKALQGDKLDSLFSFVCEDPRHHLNGWPDLVLLDAKNRLTLVEVKTKDKLLYNQIRSLPRIAKHVDDLYILRVKRTK